jgi:hypothetical protein
MLGSYIEVYGINDYSICYIPKLQYYKIKNQSRLLQKKAESFWKKFLVIDYDRDSTFIFKLGSEDDDGHGDKFNSNIRSPVGLFAIKRKAHIMI